MLLFGTLLLWLLAGRRRGPAVNLAVVACIALGVMAKASFTIYLSMAVWVVFWRDPGISWGQRTFRALPFGAVLLSAVAFFAVISRRGGYTTANFSVEKILPNLASSAGVLFLVILLTPLVWSVRARLMGRGEQIPPLSLTPAVGLAAFLAIFLPWGIAAYIQSVIAPSSARSSSFPPSARNEWKMRLPRILGALAAALCALLAGRIWGNRWFWIYGLGVLALFTGTYRSYVNFSRLGDLGAMVAVSPEWEKGGIHEIYMPCAEGSGAMQRFFDKVSGAKIQVLPWKADPPALLEGRYVLFDQGLCPLPGRAPMVSGCSGEPVFEGTFAKSYRLVKLHCPGS